jgi:hypothetical protein
MAKDCYFEIRKSTRGEGSITADAMRHLNTRQHLGKALVVSNQPIIFMGAARKQWLKLSRTLQRQRASTLNADKILKYTHAVTRMQRMYFSIKTPLERPEADVYFLSPQDLHSMPANCWTTYLLCPIDTELIANLLPQLPDGCLMVDYTQGTMPWQEFGVEPKKVLESKVHREWLKVQDVLHKYRININRLLLGDNYNVEAVDDAMDTLLGGHAHEFLSAANNFQRALELARPLRLSRRVRTAYDSLILLAHRVQALTPSAFSKHFLEVYNEDDTFFLYDKGRGMATSQALADALAHHTKAGRHHLARSLQSLLQTAS